MTPIRGIDGLRGFAILFAMAVHVRHLTEDAPLAHRFASLGGTAVYLFFSVSGWLLFHTWHHRSEKRPFSAREFFVRRAVRILPLWWILVSFVWWWKDLNPLVAISQYSFLFGFVSFDSRWLPIPIAWSLFAEEILYLFFPLFFLRIRSLRAAMIAWISATVLGVAFVMGGRQLGWPEANHYLFRSPIFAAQFFFLGVLLWRWQQERPIKFSHWVLDGVALVSFVGLWWDRNLLIVPHIASIFLCALSHESWIGRALQASWIQSFGRYCYAIYLFHFLVAEGLAIWPGPLHGTTGFLLHWALVAGLSWLIAHTTHRFLENPLRRWVDGIYSNRNPAPSAS